MKSVNIVVSRYKKNVDWVYKIKGDVNVLIYDKENPKNKYNVPVNKGNEASVYLKYIIDHYDVLPDFTYFIHDDEYAWHHSGSVVNKYYEAIMKNQLYYNINDKCILGSIKRNRWYKDICIWYNQYIEKYIPMSSLPNQDWTVGFKGSAQFLVHRDLIKKLPIEFYQDLYNWIITTDMPNAKSGRFLEWTWHIFWNIYPFITKDNK
jgi:hypothetical protein